MGTELFLYFVCITVSSYPIKVVNQGSDRRPSDEATRNVNIAAGANICARPSP